MCLSLEFRKQGLAEHSGAEALEEVVEHIRAPCRIGFGGKEIFCKQHLIDRGRDLGNHDLVIVVHVILRRVGIVGMHGVTQLMRQCECVVEGIRVVEQHVRMRAVDTHGIRTGRFAGRFVYVDPVFGKRSVEQGGVFLSKRRESLLHQLLTACKRHRVFHIRRHRAVEVEHVQLRQMQDLFAQLQIFLHRRQCFVNAPHQTVVHGYRDISGKQSGFAGGIVPTDRGEHIVLFHVSGVEGRKRVVVLFVRAEHGVERVFPDLAAGGFAVHAEIAGGQLDHLAVFVLDLRDLHLHVGEHVVGVGRGTRDLCDL